MSFDFEEVETVCKFDVGVHYVNGWVCARADATEQVEYYAAYDCGTGDYDPWTPHSGRKADPSHLPRAG